MVYQANASPHQTWTHGSTQATYKRFDLPYPLNATYVGFWMLTGIGLLDDVANNPNPLFVYSGVAVDLASQLTPNPGAGFHLATAVSKVARDNQVDPSSVLGGILSTGPVSDAFKSQFEASCFAFQRLIKSNPQRLRIRIFVGDAIAFCMGLRQLREPGYTATCYTQPGSLKPLVLASRDQGSTSSKLALLSIRSVYSICYPTSLMHLTAPLPCCIPRHELKGLQARGICWSTFCVAKSQ